jgi:uncharacterized membrane protein YtjA (UPF0391 family)
LPLHPKFSHFQFSPHFEHITTEAQVDHLAVYTVKKASLMCRAKHDDSVRTPIRSKEIRRPRETYASTSALKNEQRKAYKRNPNSEIYSMLSYALIFLVIAIVAGVLGFSGIAGTAAWIAHVCFVIFLVLFIVSLIFRGRPSV